MQLLVESGFMVKLIFCKFKGCLRIDIRNALNIPGLGNIGFCL